MAELGVPCLTEALPLAVCGGVHELLELSSSSAWINLLFSCRMSSIDCAISVQGCDAVACFDVGLEFEDCKVLEI